MKKSTAIVLLSIVSFLMAFVLVFSFLRFPVGIHDYNSVVGAIDLDYDIEGGVSYTLSLNRENDEEVKEVEKVIDVLSARLDELGYKAFTISAIKDVNDAIEDYDIRINVEERNTNDADINAIIAFGALHFYGGEAEDPTTEILTEKNPIKDAKFAGSNGDGSYLVSVEFSDYGYDNLISEIKAHESFYLKLAIGENTILSGQISATDITNKTIYINTGSESGARQTAMQIRTGGLQYKYDVKDSFIANPLYGENIALYIGIAIAVALVVAIVLLIVFFRGYGIVGALSLIVFALTEMAMLVAIPGIKLSLAGVVGAVIALAICVEGIVSTAKKIRLECLGGKTVKAGVKVGFRKSLFANVSVSVISGLVGLLVFSFARGAVQCFGITLGVGAVISFLVNVLIARMFTALILPLVKNKESFLNVKKEDN